MILRTIGIQLLALYSSWIHFVWFWNVCFDCKLKSFNAKSTYAKSMPKQQQKKKKRKSIETRDEKKKSKRTELLCGVYLWAKGFSSDRRIKKNLKKPECHVKQQKTKIHFWCCSWTIYHQFEKKNFSFLLFLTIQIQFW